MLGHLVPCGGGRSIPLPKARLILGPRRRTDDQSEPTIGLAELRLVDGWWSVRKLAADASLTVNDKPCDQGRLLPNDVISVGKSRYRIEYVSPDGAAKQPGGSTPAVGGEPLLLGLLVPCGGGPAIPLKKPKIIIGRAATCDIVLESRTVSAWHCALELVDGHWRLVDLDSNNGSHVDGLRYLRKCLFPGNILGIGGLRYRLEYLPRGTRPPADAFDVVVTPRQSLMKRVGLDEHRLDQQLAPEEPDEDPTRPRWNIDDDEPS